LAALFVSSGRSGSRGGRGWYSFRPRDDMRAPRCALNIASDSKASNEFLHTEKFENRFGNERVCLIDGCNKFADAA
jgi:hypothetical protein